MRRVIVEQIPWAYACCDALITAEDVASASRFQSASRRNEHLAWRRVVRRELGRAISIDYNAVGAPVVSTPDTYISVSHGAGCVAVAISDSRVGIDIESTERDFAYVRSRYMSPEEEQLSSDTNWPAMVWAAKEALYKLYGKRGIGLRDELQIESYDANTQQLKARVGVDKEALVDIELYDDTVVVATAYYN